MQVTLCDTCSITSIDKPDEVFSHINLQVTACGTVLVLWPGYDDGKRFCNDCQKHFQVELANACHRVIDAWKEKIASIERKEIHVR